MEPRNPFQGIDFASHVAWQAGTKNMVVVPACQAENRFLSSLKGLLIRAQVPLAKLLVPDWGIKSTMAKGCRTDPPANVALRAGTTTFAIVDFIPPSQD